MVLQISRQFSDFKQSNTEKYQEYRVLEPATDWNTDVKKKKKKREKEKERKIKK